VVAEIEYGIAKSGRRRHNRCVFDGLVSGFRVHPFDAAAARLYGPIRAHLEKRGRLIGPSDMLIAAHAQSLDAVLVTDNTEECDRVAGLKTENWLMPR
jgi:tRNA(fMet)-specific endonuclease VapC